MLRKISYAKTKNEKTVFLNCNNKLVYSMLEAIYDVIKKINVWYTLLT